MPTENHTTLPPHPARPHRPRRLRELLAAQRDRVRRTVTDLLAGDVAQAQITALFTLDPKITAWLDTDEGRAYRAAIAAYNAQVYAYNATLAQIQGAAANAAKAAKVRAARCPRCNLIRLPSGRCGTCDD